MDPRAPAIVSVASVALIACASGCAGGRWRDEPGLLVAPSRAANVEAADRFMDALTVRRRDAGQPPPVVAGRLQLHIEKLAEAVQRGDLSAPGARDEAARWGRTAYRRAVETFLIDCGAPQLDLPGTLLGTPTLVISYAAAHLHPRSLTAEQCAVIVVAVTGAVQVHLEAP